MKFQAQEGTAKEFLVTTNENGFPVLYLDGEQIPSEDIHGFSVSVEEIKDLVVTIDMSSTTRRAAFSVSVRKVTIDGYKSVGRVKDLTPPNLSFGPKLKEATLDNPNWLARFISDCCQEVPDGAVGQKTLYRAYEKWAAGHVLYTLPEFDFLQAMREAGYQRKRVGRKLYWANLSLTRPDESREPDAEEKKRLLSLLKDEPDRPAATDSKRVKRAVGKLRDGFRHASETARTFVGRSRTIATLD